MARVSSLAGRAIEQHSSPNVGGKMTAHRGIVLHIAEGTYRGTISWQNNPNQRYADGTRVTTSSTWIVGKNTGEWAQMVDTDTIAWTQRSGSYDWNSIELAGFAPEKPTAWQIEACAQLLAWHHRHYGTPLQVADHPGERGLGHHSMDREWLGEEWGHEACPGAGVIGAKAAIVKRAKEIVNEEDDMTPEETHKAVWKRDAIRAPEGYDEQANPTWTAENVLRSAHLYARSAWARTKELAAGQEAILAAVTGQDVVAAVKAELARHEKAMADRLAALTGQLTTAVVQAIPQADQATVEAALRNVLGSLDEA